jgi:adenylate cyclase, class 2
MVINAMEEIEVKFTNIDRAKLEAKIVELGGQKVFSLTYRIYVFDYPDLRLNNQSAWLRLRYDGTKTMLAYKQRQGVKADTEANDDSMLEYEVEVSDFEATADILRRIGLTEKFQEEKRRTSYVLDGVELDIDEMPLLSPYLEIEAGSWEEVDSAITKLGLSAKDKKICSAFQLYEQNGINMLDYKILKFDQQTKR